MKVYVAIITLTALAMIGGCKRQQSFSQDVAFLEKHVEVITLSSADGSAKVAVVPEYQGRVMTSTTGSGESF